MPSDCCECGACCFSKSDQYVLVTAADGERLGQRFAEATSEIEGKHYLRMQEGHCAQLEFAEGAWVCGIYNRRPLACRELQRGSPACLAERTLKLAQIRRMAYQVASPIKA